jgi:hypothetical protein
MQLWLVLSQQPERRRQQQHIAEMIRFDHQDTPRCTWPGADKPPRHRADADQQAQAKRSA